VGLGPGARACVSFVSCSGQIIAHGGRRVDLTFNDCFVPLLVVCVFFLVLVCLVERAYIGRAVLLRLILWAPGSGPEAGRARVDESVLVCVCLFSSDLPYRFLVSSFVWFSVVSCFILCFLHLPSFQMRAQGLGWPYKSGGFSRMRYVLLLRFLGSRAHTVSWEAYMPTFESMNLNIHPSSPVTGSAWMRRLMSIRNRFGQRGPSGAYGFIHLRLVMS
jgi:hypothetical protein